MADQNYCASCGMPMKEAADFGGGRKSNFYCVHCCNERGNLKSYDEVLEGLKLFTIQAMGLSEEEALKLAEEGLSKMPAWSGRKIKT
ncbi:MAG: AraC family transcriptional regulator [Candidatus Aminicenantes bacterium]|nr:AraC family transcriptional regulator [Candidatus Aminicenantes bacterium]